MDEIRRLIRSLPTGKVISNIPIPQKGKRQVNSSSKANTLRKMNFGDFMKVPLKTIKTWSATAHKLGKQEGFAIVLRKLDSRHYGIWKIERKG